MAQINNLPNQAQLPPTVFRCSACPRTFEGSVSYSRHIRLHRPHERIRRRNAESDVAAEEVPRVPQPVDEAVVDAENNNSQNQAPLLPTIFVCPACPLTFVCSISFSRHVSSHTPHERLSPRNVEPNVTAEELHRVPEPVVEPPAALPRSRNAVGSSRVLPPVEGAPQQPVVVIPGAVNVVGRTRSHPFLDSKGRMGEGTRKKGRKDAGKKTKSAVQDAVFEEPDVAVPPPMVPPAGLTQAEIKVEQPRARPMFDLNKLPNEQDQ